jgi:hypothetical protein
MEYREFVTIESGVSRFMGVVGEDWMLSFVLEIDGPIGGEWRQSVDFINQISRYELDVPWYGGGGIS